MTCYENTTQDLYDAHKDEPGACFHIDKGRLVVASGSSSVEASGSSSVEAYGSSSVEAYGSSSVRAYGSSSVVASGSSSVRAYDSSSVEAGPAVPVQQYPSYTGTTTGGVVIEIPDLDNAAPDVWTSFYGVKPGPADGTILVYKAVNPDLVSGHGMAYPVGETVTATDWSARRACGQGLHFGPTPRHALSYASRPARFLACQVDAASIVALGDKIKAPSCVVLHEVDDRGRQITAETAPADPS